MQMNGLFELELETIENAKCLEDVDTSKTREVKVHLSKILSMNDNMIPETSLLFIDKSILLNDIKSLPNLDYKVTLKNYLTIPISDNSFKNINILKDTNLYVMLPNKNIRDMKIINI